MRTVAGIPMRAWRAWVGGALLALLAIPALRNALEAVMATHMLVQIPLLAIAGGLLASDLPAGTKARLAAWNRGGVSGVLLALLASSWWMAPIALDLAIASPAMETVKFLTLPLCVGAPVALSWSALGPIGRGFVIANVLPMWAVVGWIYVVAPVRVCNYYLVDQQVTAGRWLIIASIAVGVATCVAALAAGRGHVENTSPAPTSL